MPLAGFGKAFDGPPIDPAVLEQQQKQLQEQMQKQAEEMRKKLEQGGGAPALRRAPAAPEALIGHAYRSQQKRANSVARFLYVPGTSRC